MCARIPPATLPPCHLAALAAQNDLGEFYAMVNFINPGVLGDPSYFRKTWERKVLLGREPDATDLQRQRGEAASGGLSELVNDFIIRRTNEILSAHLPPKLVQLVCCNMTELQVPDTLDPRPSTHRRVPTHRLI